MIKVHENMMRYITATYYRNVYEQV